MNTSPDYRTKDHDNEIWNRKSYLAVAHLDAHIRNIYKAFENNKNEIRMLKENYPHGCITTLGELVQDTEVDVEYIDSFDYVNFTYADLRALEKNKKFIDINAHIGGYITRMLSFLNSYSISVNDIQMLTNKSGAKSINLCGNFELYNNTLTFYNKKNWIRKNGYEPIYSDIQCYWKSYPYSTTLIPEVSDFKGRINDINVIFFSNDNWVPILVFVRTEENEGLVPALNRYVSNMQNFLKTDGSKTHHWDQWEFEHQRLQKFGIKVWKVKYSELFDKLIEIHLNYDIPLTQKESVKYDKEIEEKYMSAYLRNNKPEIYFNTTESKEPIIRDEKQEYYWYEYIFNEHFLDEISLLQNIPVSLHKFLISNRFLEKHGSYDNVFKYWINNRYYRELSSEFKETLIKKYTISEIDYQRLEEDKHLFIKLESKIICPEHKSYDPLYYRPLSEEELEELEKKGEYSHGEYESLIIHGRLNPYTMEYDENARLYFIG